MAFGVPVMVTVPVVPEQIVLALMVAVGAGVTVIVAHAVTVCVQDGVPAELTLTKQYTEFAVKTGEVIVAVPEAFKTTD